MPSLRIGFFAVPFAALVVILAPITGCAQTTALPHDPQGVEICGVRLGVSTFDQVRQMLEQGVQTRKFADLSYYEGRYFDTKSTVQAYTVEDAFPNGGGTYVTYRAYRPVTDSYQNYDAQHWVRTITGFWAYSDTFPRVPFQMFFFRGVVYKIDLSLQPGLTEDLKAGLDRQYGKGQERSIPSPYGQGEVWGYQWVLKSGSLAQVEMLLDTGMHSIDPPNDFYLNRVDDKMPDSFYCNFFDRALERAYLEYEKTMDEQHEQDKK